MKASKMSLIAVAIAILVPLAAGQSDKAEAEISQALAAAPASIAAQAAVVILRDQGRKEELRAGTNGWTFALLVIPVN